MVFRLLKISLLCCAVGGLLISVQALATNNCFGSFFPITLTITKDVHPDDPLSAEEGLQASLSSYSMFCQNLDTDNTAMYFEFSPTRATEQATRPIPYHLEGSSNQLFTTSLKGIAIQAVGSSFSQDPINPSASSTIEKVLDSHIQQFQYIPYNLTSIPRAMFGAKVAIIVNDLDNVEGGDLGSIELGHFTATNEPDATIPLRVSGKINIIGCSATMPAAPVDMGTVSVSSFQSRRGPPVSNGTNPAAKINVSCFSSQRIQMRINGANGDYDASQGLVSLTPDSTSKGVVIQLLYNDKPVSLGTDIVINESPAALVGVTNTKVVLEARYYRIGDLTPGTANGTVNVVFTYN